MTRLLQIPSTSLILGNELSSKNRATRRKKQKKLHSWDKVHKAEDGRVFAKGYDGDRAISNGRYDGRFA